MSERKKGKERERERERERLPFLAERSHPERRERREEEGVANNERGRLCFQPLRTMNDAAGKREEGEERRGWKGGGDSFESREEEEESNVHVAFHRV